MIMVINIIKGNSNVTTLSEWASKKSGNKLYSLKRRRHQQDKNTFNKIKVAVY